MKKSLIALAGIVLFTLFQTQLKAQNFKEAVDLSHAGKYTAAEKIFIKLIAADSRNASLLIASGFNNAWGNEYSAAKQRFSKALELEPGNTDAAKGMAYTYLYEGSFFKATAAFEKLIVSNPASEEFHMAAGLAYMNMQKRGRAALHFKKVLQVNSKNEEARQYLTEINTTTGVIEIGGLAGMSGSGGQTKFGLRQLQLSYQFNPENLLFVRYDNSLSLDNFFLLKNNYNVNALSAGVYSKWNKYIGSKFEFGQRNLPDGVKQNLWQTEQVIFLPKKYVLKFGGSLITSNLLEREWMAMTSIAIPATDKVLIEPHYYFIKRQSSEHRGVLNVSYHFNPHNDVGFGMFAGSENNTALKINNTVAGGYIYSNFSIKGPFCATALLRYEKDAAGSRDAFIAAAGLKYRINTKKNHL